MGLFGGTIGALENSLNYASTKNNAIANNIANIDTPNFKAKSVVFKDVLNQAMDSSVTAKRTHPLHIPFNNEANGSFQTISKGNTSYNHNGNNVDIDKEMAELAKNQIYYQGLVDRISGKFRSLQTVIKGGS